MSAQNLGMMEIPRGHLGPRVHRGHSGMPDRAPTGYCRPSEYPLTSMPAMLPHPGPTCTAWPPAATGPISCLCLNETDAGHYGQGERGWEGAGEGCQAHLAGYSLLTTHLSPCSCLDVEAMQEAAQHLLGTHDFSAFQSAGSPVVSSVRTLRRASVSPDLGSPFVLPQENR